MNSTFGDNYVNDSDEFHGTTATTMLTTSTSTNSSSSIVADENKRNECSHLNDTKAANEVMNNNRTTKPPPTTTTTTTATATATSDATTIGRSPLSRMKATKCDTIERNRTLLTNEHLAINSNCNNDNLINSNSCNDGGGSGDSNITSCIAGGADDCGNNGDKFSDVNGGREGDRKAGGYLIAVHRKLSRQDTYFLSFHKTRPSLFGVPLLIPCYEDGTNKDLYCAVWIQVARLLSPLPATPPDQSNHATDW